MFAEVIVDILNSNVDKIFDYQLDFDASVGTRVLVPFGNRKVEGYILNLKQTSSLEKDKIKKVTSCDKTPIIIPEMLSMIDFLTENFALRKMDAIRLFVPSGLRKNRVKQKVVSYAKFIGSDFDVSSLKKSAKKQIEMFCYMQKNKQEQVSVLNKKFGNAVAKKLLGLNIISIFNETQNRLNLDYVNTEKKQITLTSTQVNIANTICNGKDDTFLLFGVTGSGKTEVYMEVIRQMLLRSKTAIMLVPEISLTPQVLRHFKAKFKDDVAILHSGLSSAERFDEWFRILNGEAHVVVGARSAIFAPLKNLGVIVIDEEHDSSYYSESNPRYSTIEVAKFRSKYNGAPLVLGSATPDVESFYNAKIGNYKLLEMPERINKAPMPKFVIVDMLQELKNGNMTIFSNVLLNKLEQCLKTGKQAMIYLNRRGYQSSVVCRDCGNVVKCEHCDVPLVYHKEDNMLKCHYCDARYKVLDCCPNCGSKNLRYGAIGTQKVVEEIKKIFPNNKVFRMDNDSTKSKDSHYKILEQFSQSPASILVGTQMIAKGHDFPLVTLVGIIDADMSLHFADFRASERTFSLITQVAGRAGRGEYQGEVVLQTYMPNNHTYQNAVNYNYNNFFKHELNIREVTKFPPFSTILRVLISSDDEKLAIQKTKEYMSKIEEIRKTHADDFIYLSAMKCPVKKIQNKVRYQILMRLTQKEYTIIRNLIYNVDRNLKQKDVTTFVEVNPQNLS